MKPTWQLCWCYRHGRCLSDCPTANVPKPRPLTDESWRRAYEAAVMAYNAAKPA